MSDEQSGIAAFATAAVAASFETSGDAILTLFHRPNDPSVTFQVKREDIIRIVPGGDENGCRLLQVLLRPGSVVETKVEMLRNVRNLQDPTLKHLTATAISTHSSLST